MSNAPIHLTMLTLGVRDLSAATAFYEAMGLRRSADSQETVTFFDMGGVVLGLYGWDALAEDAKVPERGDGFRGATMAWNQSDEGNVDASLARAVACGGTLVKAAEKVFWGGYSGYFSDPDGHLWEVAYNPFSTLREDGSMTLSPPAGD